MISLIQTTAECPRMSNTSHCLSSPKAKADFVRSLLHTRPPCLAQNLLHGSLAWLRTHLIDLQSASLSQERLFNFKIPGEQARHCLLRFLEGETCHGGSIPNGFQTLLPTHAWRGAHFPFSLHASVVDGKELSSGGTFANSCCPISALCPTWWHNLSACSRQP